MSPRPLLLPILLLPWLSCCGDGPPPNVFLIVIDTARADHFSCYGYERPTTPNLDALAQDAVLYTNARAAAPWTLPSHASMFTGHWPGEHGLNWGTANQTRAGAEGPERAVVRQQGRQLAEVLSQQGYTTVGLSNNAWVSARSGLDAGFQQFIPMYSVMDALREEFPTWPPEWKVPDELARQNAGMTVARFKRLYHEGLGAPFFAFFNVTEPHFPYNARGVYRGRFGSDPALTEEMGRRGGPMERALLSGAESADPQALRDSYDEELLGVDAVLGDLFQWLKEQHLYDDAMIVVTSDHGELLGEGGRYSHQLAVSKELLWVPLIVKYPGQRNAGTREANPLVSNLDVYETILAAAAGGTRHPTTWSRDLAHMERLDRDWTLSEYYYSDDYLDGLQRMNPDFDKDAHRMIRRVVHLPGGNVEFHDREAVEGADPPPALRDLMSRYDQTVAELPVQYQGETTLDQAVLEQLRENGYVE